MERTLTAALSSAAPHEWRRGLSRLLPLWRHAAWGLALFVLLGVWVEIRLDVQALRKDLDRTGRAAREERVTSDRLRLELDTRRRVVRMEHVAQQLGLTSTARVVQVAER